MGRELDLTGIDPVRTFTNLAFRRIAMRWRILVGMTMVALPIGAGCSGFRPQIEAVTARIEGIDLKGVDLVFDIDVRNPYPVAIRPPNYRYVVDIAGAAFVKGDATSDSELPASGVGTISLPARLEYLQLWQSYQNLRESREVPYKLHGALVLTMSERDNNENINIVL